jgi:ZIP family zinc transporter
VLASVHGPAISLAYGIMYALVAGMMIFISLSELLPSAYKFSRNQGEVTLSVFLGMSLMAFSLVLFELD